MQSLIHVLKQLLLVNFTTDGVGHTHTAIARGCRVNELDFMSTATKIIKNYKIMSEFTAYLSHLFFPDLRTSTTAITTTRITMTIMTAAATPPTIPAIYPPISASVPPVAETAS